ncbi:S-adenosylmethionine decarboxylase [Candidatus Kaiserbacteria bacterium RIFCSPHIGHO2_12_FULL_53_13]|uniref:S-adenosylmethionine decarboxylase n=1 Tax=Candidatus Kaiserbacteria bacterium RIFCSPHIGHO2_12_FULL_53_13 TaxID=1798502 RepID=A0A1F6E7N4_9BACT|nr:MAG: S-adenosylmethionine decarboxylase [Candidatus Kaiserbacteria bacterium RIFCSPHIGHO2_12_FULL_53_13]
METAQGEQGLREKYRVVDAWGMSSGIDLHNCNPETIRSAEKIKQFVVELCEKIDMKRFGECTVVNFGEDEKVAGFSMSQFIETSMISAHFANQTNTTYLDIFSCKYYSPYEAADFAKKFFEASAYTLNYALRK